MPQKFFTTHRAQVESFPLGEQRIGLLKPGRYNGYDIIEQTSTLGIKLKHSGLINKTLKTGTPENSFGALLFPTGTVLHDTDNIDLTINTNSSNSNPRTDFIICEHDYQAIQGGTQAVYNVIQGPNDSSIPILPNPEKQVLIGTIVIKANGYTFNDLTYKPALPPLPGDLTYGFLTTLINSTVQVPDATTTVKGKAAIATLAELKAGISDKMVVPSTLLALEATDTQLGLVKKASNTEVISGSDDQAYITSKKLKDNILSITAAPKEIIADDKTLTAADNGKIFIALNNKVGGTITTVTVPRGLPLDFHAVFIQHGGSTLSLVGASGVTLNTQPGRLPTINTIYSAILLESLGIAPPYPVDTYTVLGSLKQI